jgi:hypothetical protein
VLFGDRAGRGGGKKTTKEQSSKLDKDETG